nr:hypothetical protein [Corynebacterium lactis]
MQVIDGGQPRVVDVVDDGQGRGVVIDAYGVPTGETVTSDGRGGYALVPPGAVVGKVPGEQALGVNEAAPSSGEEDSAEHRPHEQEVPAKGAGGQKVTSDVMAASTEGAGVAGGAAAALIGAAVGAARRFRRGGRGVFGRVHEFGWVQPDGDVQRFMVVPDASAPHEHRFDVVVPPDGEMVTNPDGSVDVVDSQGRVVDHVRRPWAFDAAGRPVKTWYEIDNQRGQLVQKVAPDQSVVYPIVADPEQDKSRVVKGAPRAVAGKGMQVRPAVKPAVSSPAPPKTASSRGSSSERARLDATVPARQPGFIGPVTAEDAAGQQRNKAKIQRQQVDRAAAQRRGSGVKTSKEIMYESATGQKLPTERQVQPASTRPRHPVDEMSPEGDHITRDAQGRIDGVYPHGAPAGVRKTRNPDGSVTVTEGGRQTTYYPAPDKPSRGEMVVESQTFDRDRNQTRQVLDRDGARVEQVVSGRQEVNAPVGAPVKSVPVATPSEPVAGEQPIPSRGKSGGNGAAKAAAPKESIRGPGRIGDAATASGGLGEGLLNDHESPGRHRSPRGELPKGNAAWRGIGKAAKGVGAAGNAYTLGKAGIDAWNDPTHVGHHVGKGLGSVAGGTVGAYAGSALGAFGGPIAPVTIPLGAALGAYLGSTFVGDPVGTAVGDAVDQNISGR